VSIFANTNNPGNLTAPGGASLYPGQTGSYTSLNGFTYAVFGSVQDGYNALVDYVQRNLPKYSTPSAFVQHYLGTSTPNAANSNPAGYQATTAPAINSGDPNAIATAISKAEGSSLAGVNTGGGVLGNILGRNTGQTDVAGLSGNLASDFQNLLTGTVFAVENPGNIVGAAISPNNITTAQAKKATADATALNPISWIKSGGLILLGIILVGLAAFLLARGGKALAS
jgi:hypothetical protein